MGDTARVGVKVLDQAGEELSGWEVEWSSSDAEVAGVSSDGLVTARANGKAALVASSDEVSDTVWVTVRQVAETVTVVPDSLRFLTQQEGAVTAGAKDANGNAVRLAEIPGAAFAWATTEATVAMVSAEGDAAGRVTAVGVGVARITASLDGAAGSAWVAVEARVATVVEADRDSVGFGALGDTARIGVRVLDQAGEALAGAKTEWSSSDAEVAGVSSDGLVTARANGTAALVASSDEVSDTVWVTVRQVAETVTVVPDSLRFLTRQEGAVTAGAKDANGNAVRLADIPGAAFSWATTDATVVMVSAEGDAAGRVTAVGVGVARVTASLDGASGSVWVVVEARVATVVEADRDSVRFGALGDTSRIGVRVWDQAGEALAGAKMDWSSSDPEVATVSSSGLVTAKGNGTATVVALSGTAADTAWAAVRQVPASVKLSTDSLHLLTKQSGDVSARVRDANGNAVRLTEIPGAGFAWATTDATVAMVSAEGDAAARVTAVGVGVARITASLDGASGSAWVAVEARVATVVEADRDSVGFGALGDTARIGVRVLDQAGEALAGAKMDWSSSDPEVATVSSSGLVTAKGNGTATVVALSGTASDTVWVAVRQVAASVTLSTDSLHLLTKQRGDVSASASDANGNAVRLTEIPGAAFAWTTTDGTVAMVSAEGDASGRVTAIGAGVAVVAAALDGASGETTVTVEERVATVLTADRDSLGFGALGDTARIGVRVWDQAGETLAGARVDWSSSDPEVATVSSSGLVTARGNGTAKVVALSGPVADTVGVTVRQRAARVTVEPGALLLVVGQEAGLTASAEDANGNGIRLDGLTGATFTWESGDATVATLSPVGVDSVQVLAVVAGTAHVWATFDAESDSVAVEVEAKVPGSIAVSPDAVSFGALDDTLRLAAIVTDQVGNGWPDAPVAWSTSAAKVAAVAEDGLVKAVGNGTAEVVAHSGTVADTVSVTVYQNAERVTIQPNPLLLVAGQEGVLTASAEDANGYTLALAELSGAAFSWSSGDAEVATASSLGVDVARVTALAAGTAYMWATLEDVSDSVAVAVVGRVATTITLSEGAITFDALNETLRVVAEVTDQTGSTWPDAPVTWSSSTASVATVSSSGLVMAVGNGTAKVVALSGAVADTVPLTVRQRAGSVTIEPDSLSLVATYAGNLKAVAKDANGHPLRLEELAGAAFAWVSRSALVATVESADADSVTLTAVAAGRTHVTAMLDNVYDSATVSVDARAPATVTVTPDSVVFTEISDTATLSAAVIDQMGNKIHGATVAWSSSNPTVATVSSSGLVAAKGNGTTRLAAQSGSVAGTTAVTVDVKPLTVSLGGAYLVQVVQDPRGSVPLIEGRDAVVRVFPVASRANRAHVHVKVVFDRIETSQSILLDSLEGTVSGIPTTMDESALDGFNAVVSASTVNAAHGFEVTLSGDGFTPPPPKRLKFIRVNRGEMNFVAVPVRRGVGGDTNVQKWVDGLTPNDPYLSTLNDVMPISGLSVTKHAPFTTSENLSDRNSWKRLLSDIRLLRQTDGSNGYYYGATASGSGTIIGIGYIGYRASTGIIESSVIAHEIGHNTGLKHAPCNTANGLDPNFPTNDGSIEAWGFDMSRGISATALKSPASHNDVMGYCWDSSLWISAYHFGQAAYGWSPPPSATAPSDATPPEHRRMLVVRGQTDPTPALEPAFVINAPPHLPSSGGPYRFIGESTNGGELFSYAFTPTEMEFGGSDLGGSAFSFLIPYDESWADALGSIVLTGPNGTATLTEGSTPPAALLLDRESGRLRGVLRYTGRTGMDHGPGTVVLVSDGIPRRGSAGGQNE